VSGIWSGEILVRTEEPEWFEDGSESLKRLIRAAELEECG